MNRKANVTYNFYLSYRNWRTNQGHVHCKSGTKSGAESFHCLGFYCPSMNNIILLTCPGSCLPCRNLASINRPCTLSNKQAENCDLICGAVKSQPTKQSHCYSWFWDHLCFDDLNEKCKLRQNIVYENNALKLATYHNRLGRHKRRRKKRRDTAQASRWALWSTSNDRPLPLPASPPD